MKYLVLILLCIATVAQAQEKRPTQGLPPGRSISEQPAKSYPDSTAFNKAFAELYKEIKPIPQIKERAELTLSRMGRVLKMRGVDSAKAHDSVMKAMDTTTDRRLLYDTYRSAFTAKELESLVTFFKSPVGRHYLEIESKLLDARSHQIDQYIQRTINMVITPMAKPVPHPPGPKGGMPGRPDSNYRAFPMPDSGRMLPSKPLPPTR